MHAHLVSIQEIFFKKILISLKFRLVEWLDECSSFTFRQAQVSFSSRLPHAFSVPDAMTMSCNLLLYCNYSRMDIKSVMRITESQQIASMSGTGKGNIGGRQSGEN